MKTFRNTIELTNWTRYGKNEEEKWYFKVNKNIVSNLFVDTQDIFKHSYSVKYVIRKTLATLSAH